MRTQHYFYIELAKRVREGNRDEGGVAFEFPIYSIQETLKRPTAALDRNLQYLSPVETAYGPRQNYPGADHGCGQVDLPAWP